MCKCYMYKVQGLLPEDGIEVVHAKVESVLHAAGAPVLNIESAVVLQRLQ